MITINELNHVAERNSQSGLLTDRVERDLSDALNEFGSPAVDQQAEPGGGIATGQLWLRHSDGRRALLLLHP